MLYIVVHLFAVPDSIGAMRSYEQKALRIFRRHGGEVVSAFVPETSLDEIEKPDEIQILKIESREKFDAFMKDPERLSLTDERKAAIRKTEVFVSKTSIGY